MDHGRYEPHGGGIALCDRRRLPGTVPALCERIHDRYPSADDAGPVDGTVREQDPPLCAFSGWRSLLIWLFCGGFTIFGAVPLSGSTFDPLDILAYAGGVTLGLLLDLVIFPLFISEGAKSAKE